MSKQRQNKKIDIPTEYEDEITKFIENLKLKEKKKKPITKHITEPKNIPHVEEVMKVFNHKIKNGIWWFALLFKDKIEVWIQDTNCDCEWMISNYLSTKNINTTYVFCRVSTRSQVGENHVSLDAQEEELKKIAKEKTPNNRIKVIKVVGSAYRDIPKQLLDIGESCYEGDSIFVYRVDRLSRNVIKYLNWIDELNDNNISIYSLSEKLYYNDNKLEFIQAIVDSNKESKKIGDRIRMGIKRKRDRGDESIGRLPYGKKYKRVDNGSLVVVNDEEVIDLIETINNSKLSHANIAKKLNSEERFKYGNKKWNVGMIKRIKVYKKK